MWVFAGNASLYVLPHREVVMIDVHILTMPTDNPEWFAQCLDSLKDEPVIVHLAPGIPDDIGNARANAFLLGEQKYVSFVDPDDYVLPGGFAACLDVLGQDQPVAVCTQEIVTGFRGKIQQYPLIKTWDHHLMVFKRNVVLEHLSVWRDWRYTKKQSEGQWFMQHLAKLGLLISRIQQPYYVWRRHLNSYTMRRDTHV